MIPKLFSPENQELLKLWSQALLGAGSTYQSLDPSGREAMAAGTIQALRQGISKGRMPEASIRRFANPPIYREQPPAEFVRAGIRVYGMLQHHCLERLPKVEANSFLSTLDELLSDAIVRVLQARRSRDSIPLLLEELGQLLKPEMETQRLFSSVAQRIGQALNLPCLIFRVDAYELELLGSSLPMEQLSPHRLPREEALSLERLSLNPDSHWAETLKGLGYPRMFIWPLSTLGQEQGFLLLPRRFKRSIKQRQEQLLSALSPLLAAHIGFAGQAEALEQADAAIAGLFDASPNMMCALDPLGRILRTNARFRRALVVSDDLLGMPFAWLVHPAWAQRFQEFWSSISKQQSSNQFRVDLITSSSARLPLAFEVQALREELGSQQGYLFSLWDLSEQVKRAQEDRQRIDELTAFAHHIAHDLKSPLRSIASFVSLLQEELPQENGAEVQSYCRYIEAATERSWALINGLLAFAESTELRGSSVPVSLGELLENLRSELEEELRAQNATLEIDIDESPLLGHPIPLATLLRNLVLNALHHGGEAAPRLKIGIRQLQTGWAGLSIEDQGCGIPSEAQEEIFQLFKRGPQSKGSGIGLAIVQRIAAAYGGSVQLESQEGRGCRFEIRLPTP